MYFEPGTTIICLRKSSFRLIDFYRTFRWKGAGNPLEKRIRLKKWSKYRYQYRDHINQERSTSRDTVALGCKLSPVYGITRIK